MNFNISDKLPQESIGEYAYRLLSSNILSLNLVPGTALSEKDIAELLQISRTPVREAFIRLAQENLLDILPQKGTYVAKIDLEQVAESRFLRATMENAIIKLVCHEFTRESLLQVQACLDLQELCVNREDYMKFFELDDTMHGLIFKACHKERIWKMIKQMSLNYNRVRMLTLTKGYYELPKLFEQHQQIVEAIIQKDQGLGERIIGMHINKVITDIEDLKQAYKGYFK